MQEIYNSLTFQPFPEKPGGEENEYAPLSIDAGTVVIRKNGAYYLIGDEPAGQRTNGCDCCSTQYNFEVTDGYYVGWAVLHPSVRPPRWGWE